MHDDEDGQREAEDPEPVIGDGDLPELERAAAELGRDRSVVYCPDLERMLAMSPAPGWRPDALARKYPTAPKQWGWQYVFPAARRSVDPQDAA